LVRAGIRSLLEQEPDIKIVGEAATGEEAIARAPALAPDVILLDLMMPHKTGLDAIVELKQQNPAVRILVLTGFADDEMGLEAVKAGAVGYLLKTAGVDELIRAIRIVYAGELPLHPRIARKLIRQLSHPAPPPAKDEPLTGGELAILRLVARGLSNHDVARELFVTKTTVNTHMSHIFHKLQISSRTQAALYAIRIGLINLDTDLHMTCVAPTDLQEAQRNQRDNF
jgi:two-component system, NarL family, response regulator LiaR